jgi:small-conductance mechanosensitive channel
LKPDPQDSFLSRHRETLSGIGFYATWIAFAVLGALTAFQVHAALIALGVMVVDSPTLRPTGWTFQSIYGLARVFWLLVGILWLGGVTFSEKYLRDGLQYQEFRVRSLRIFLVLAAIYLLCVVLLSILSI